MASSPALVQAGAGHVAQAASRALEQDLQCWVSGRPLMGRTTSHTSTCLQCWASGRPLMGRTVPHTSTCPGHGLSRHRHVAGVEGEVRPIGPALRVARAEVSEAAAVTFTWSVWSQLL